MGIMDIISGKSASPSSQSGASNGLYKRGVQVRFMSGAQPIRFRLLPAFNPDDSNPETSIAPWAYMDGNASTWAAQIIAGKFVGGKSPGREVCHILSRETFGERCPYRKLYNVADKDEDWKYLVARTKSTPAILPPLKKTILMNILDVDQQDRGCQVGEFSYSAAKTLFDQQTGLMWSIDPRFTEEINELNYMQQYVCGDLTCPTYGMVLRLEKDDRGQFQSYRIVLDTDEARHPYRWEIGEDVLAGRQDMNDITSFVNEMSDTEIVDKLVKTLNQRSPKGFHEYALLQEVFGDTYRIPETPSAPGAVNTVQGFTAPDTAPATPPKTRSVAQTARPVTVVAQPKSNIVHEAPATQAPVSKPIRGVPGEPLDDDLLAQLKARK